MLEGTSWEVNIKFMIEFELKLVFMISISVGGKMFFLEKKLILLVWMRESTVLNYVSLSSLL